MNCYRIDLLINVKQNVSRVIMLLKSNKLKLKILPAALVVLSAT